MTIMGLFSNAIFDLQGFLHIAYTDFWDFLSDHHHIAIVPAKVEERLNHFFWVFGNGNEHFI